MTHDPRHSLRIEVEEVDGVWIATASWLAEPITGPSFEDVYWRAVGMMPGPK